MLNIIKSMNRTQKRAVLMVLHVSLVPIALLLSWVLTHTPSIQPIVVESYLPVLPFVCCVCAVLALFVGLIEVPLQSAEPHDVGPTALLSAGLALTSLFFSSLFGTAYPTGFHVIFGLGYFLFSLTARLGLLRLVTFIYTRSDERCRVLIYGAGSTGTQLALALRGHKKIEPVAFVDDNVTLQGLRILRLPVLSSVRIAEIAAKRNISRVLLAAPSMPKPKQAKMVKKLEAMGLEVLALPSFAELIGEAPLDEKLAPASAHTFLGRDEVIDAWQAERSIYAGRVVLVTGAGGSIGAEICRQLLDLRPGKIVLFESSELALYTIDLELRVLVEDGRIDIVSVLGSVTEPRQVRRVMNEHGVQVVIHAAAYKHVPIVEENPLAGLVNNVLGTQTLVQQAMQANVERFILISSDKAVRPSNVMGASKRLAEGVVQSAAKASQDYGRPIFSIVRFGNVLGSSGSVVPLFQDQLSRGGPVTVTDPRVMRYFMTVQEAVKLVLESGSMAEGNEVFVLDMGAPVSILQLARQVIENAGYTVKDDLNPQGDIEIAIIGLRPGEKLVEELTLTGKLESTAHSKIFCAMERTIPEEQTTAALRRLREAFIASDEAMARQVAMEFVEADEVCPKQPVAAYVRA